MIISRSIRRSLFVTASAALVATFATAGTSTGQTLEDTAGTARDTIPDNRPSAVPRTIPSVAPAPVQPTGRELLLSAYGQTDSASAKADYDNIIALCRRALADDVSPAAISYGRKLMSWAYNRRGELIVEAEGEHQALADFHRAVQIDPQRWRAVHNRAVSYFALGRTDLAMSDFTRTIQLEPRFSTAYFNRGELRFEQGDLRGAVSDYDSAIRLGVKGSSAYEGRGYALLQLGRYAAAVADLNMVIRFEPNDAAAHLSRGEARAKLHRWEQAARDFNRAIALDGKLTRAYERAAWLMATCPEARFRQTKLAVDTARKAVELAGETNHGNLNVLAAAYANNGEYEKARLIQAKAIDTAPQAVSADYRQSMRQYERSRPVRESAAATQIGRKPTRRSRTR